MPNPWEEEYEPGDTLPTGETVAATRREEPRFGDQQVAEGVYVRPPWEEVISESPLTQGGAMDIQQRQPQPGETGRSWDEANQTLTITRDNPGMLEDTARGAWEGLQRGFEGIRNLPDAAGDFVARLDRERTEGFGSDPTLDSNDRNLMQQVGDAIRPDPREHYQPSSMPGRVAEKVMEYAPGAVFGPEAAIASLTGGTADAGTREVVRAAGGDQQAQDVAGTVAGVAGGFLRPRLPSPGQAPVVANTPSGGFTVARPVAPPRPGSMAEGVQQFDAANVRPNLAALGGPAAAGATKQIAENFIAGGRPRAALTGQIDDVASEANRIAGEYGNARGPLGVGEDVARGAQRFANDATAPESFAAKADEQYRDVFGRIDEAMAGKTEPPRAVQSSNPYRSSTPDIVGGSQIETPSTTTTLNSILGQFQSQDLAALLQDKTLVGVSRAIRNGETISFQDLRALRTWVRNAQRNTDLRQTIGDANLQRLEGSLTTDIFENTRRLGSPQLAADLRRADQFYAAGQRRIQQALDPLVGTSGENVYNRIQTMAREGASADVRALNGIKRSLRPDEWNDVAATMISRLGKPNPGATGAVEDGAFSINTFVTNYNKLSPQGRAVLFGPVGGGSTRSTALAAQLDRLVRVADRLKGVEAMANSSRTGVNAQNAVTFGGVSTGMGGMLMGNPVPAVATGAMLGAMAGTGEVLTNPAVVRWIVRLGEARTPQAFNARLLKLKAEGAQSPALMALAQRIEAYQAEQEQGQPEPVQ